MFPDFCFKRSFIFCKKIFFYKKKIFFLLTLVFSPPLSLSPFLKKFFFYSYLFKRDSMEYNPSFCKSLIQLTYFVGWLLLLKKKRLIRIICQWNKWPPPPHFRSVIFESFLSDIYACKANPTCFKIKMGYAYNKQNVLIPDQCFVYVFSNQKKKKNSFFIFLVLFFKV